MDSETGLYYYGARYLDPKYSHWLSPDPAMGKYIPEAPVNDEAKKHNQNLPGGGGVFNTINMQVYHYAGNNPVKYTDPDGEIFGVDDVVEGVAIGVLFIGITADMTTGSYQEGVNAAVGAASEGLNTVREEMNALGNKAQDNINSIKDSIANQKKLGEMKRNPPTDPSYKPPIQKGALKKVKLGDRYGWPAKDGKV